MDREYAKHFLSKDILLHIDMLQAFENMPLGFVRIEKKGVALQPQNSDILFLSAESPQIVKKLLLGWPFKFSHVVVHQFVNVSFFEKNFGMNYEVVCYQAAYLKKDNLPLSNPNLRISALDIEHFDFIKRHYSHDIGDEYIAARLLQGNMYGGYIDGEIVGFIGLHEEGTMGLLEVLPQYHRMKIASTLQAWLSNHLISQGKTPMAQIVQTNTASLSLQRSMGFEISDQLIYWMCF